MKAPEMSGSNRLSRNSELQDAQREARFRSTGRINLGSKGQAFILLLNRMCEGRAEWVSVRFLSISSYKAGSPLPANFF